MRYTRLTREDPTSPTHGVSLTLQLGRMCVGAVPTM
jgi:hypothetical protein